MSAWKWAPLKHQQKKGPLAEGRETPGASRARGRVWLFDHYTVKQKLKKIIKNLAHWVTCNFEFDTNVLVHCRCRAVWTKSKMREWRQREKGGVLLIFLFVLSVLGHWKLTRFARAALKTLHPKPLQNIVTPTWNNRELLSFLFLAKTPDTDNNWHFQQMENLKIKII